MSNNPQVIELPKLNLKILTITLIGDSSLITHKWSEKAIKGMLDKQMKKAKGAREAKDPWMDFCHSLYWLSDMPAKPTEATIKKAKFGFPAVAFKAAAVNACSQVDGLTKVNARASFHIDKEFVIIQGTPEIREDMVRIAMGTADIRYRGEFKKWKAEFELRYNANVLSAEQIVNLFNVAGFGVGVGEWRPQKNGSYGMFHVMTEGES
jgi:hypothetical protein